MGSELLFNALLEALPDLVWAQDQEGVYLACSASYAHLLGLSQAELVGKTDADLPATARGAARALGAGAPGEAERDERWLCSHDGAQRGLFQVFRQPLPGADGLPAGIIGIAREITALYEAQTALHQSAAHYRALFETLVHGVVFHASDGQIIDANPAAAAILGLSADQITGRTSLDRRWHAIREDGSPFPGDEHPAMVALRTGRPVIDVTMGVYNPLKGEYTWIKVSAIPQPRAGAGTPYEVYATFEDITAQKRAQAELEGYRRQLEELVAERTAALEAANSRLRRSDMRLQAMLDLSRRASELNEAELLQIGVNEAVRLTESTIGYLHLLGADQETIELLSWSDGAREQCTASPEGHAPVSRAGLWADTVRRRRPVIHNDFQGLAGQPGLVDGHSEVWRHLGVPVVEGDHVQLLLGVGNKASDYDEVDARELLLLGGDLWRLVMRLRAEAALRESEARYRALFDATPDALALIDIASGRFIDCNAAAARMFASASRGELLGRRPEELSPALQPSGRPSAELAALYLARAVAEGGFTCEWTHRRDDGTLFPALISLCGVHFHGREQVLMVGRDISELKRYQAELEQARDAAEAANRAKSAFLAAMSHELRTPLSAIIGRAELLREQIYGPVTERQREALTAIEASGAQLTEQINAILDLSKVEAGQIELFSEQVAAETLCQDALQLVYTMAAERRIALSVRCDEAVGLVTVDAWRFRQILVNLLSNAVKFTPPGGRVGLEVSCDVGRSQATFTVWDTGIGIAAEDLPRLFQPFVQIDARLSRSYEGSGLGLALVLRLTELHGGSVDVESRPGVGSRFSVTVPWGP